MARSCAPPLEECPVTVTGSSPNRARKNSVVVQPQDSTIRQPMATRAVITAVTTHASACSTRPTRDSSTAGSSTSVTGEPVASATVNGTDSSAPTHHTSADQPAARSAA